MRVQVTELRSVRETLLLCLLLSFHPARAETGRDFEAEYQAAMKANPKGISLEARLHGGKARYHTGEVILLDLLFSNSSKDVYSLFPGARRSDRTLELFRVAPSAGTADPLADYHHSGLDGNDPMFPNDETRWIPLSPGGTEIVPVILNEWLRFTRPGKYRFYVVSRSLASGRLGFHAFTPVNTLPVVTSHQVELEILPEDPKWTRDAYRKALHSIDAPASKADDADRDAAFLMMRCLDTEESVKVLLRWGAGFFDELLGSRHRDLIVKELTRQMEDPEDPGISLDDRYLHLLSVEAALLHHPEPVAIQPLLNEQNPIGLRRQDPQLFRSYSHYFRAFWDRLRIACPHKHGEALKACTTALERMQVSYPTPVAIPKTAASPSLAP